MLCTPVLTQMLIQGTMPLKAKSSSFLYGTTLQTNKQTTEQPTSKVMTLNDDDD